MTGLVYPAIDWRTCEPARLDGARCVLRTASGTVIDGRLKAHPPDGSNSRAARRYTLDDTDLHLTALHVLSIDPRAGTRILQPHVTNLTTIERNPA
ncbi:hypothetical protein [Bifidobacterium platyrrhinorum]|uniref:Uncharacterized protein n=1 Tax=Bifidobacterium platyrrhinorum TaxID=2661628 RepID=A0A6L9SVU7_9BIFI|nr:hypothetical protein [Bifidobacterium platyrrhinorum]NEG56155.1 hypothetical protein [Bifidobacterium platyrrhinorum]